MNKFEYIGEYVVMPHSKYEHNGRGWYEEGFNAYAPNYQKYTCFQIDLTKEKGYQLVGTDWYGMAVAPTKEEAIAKVKKSMEKYSVLGFPKQSEWDGKRLNYIQ